MRWRKARHFALQCKQRNKMSMVMFDTHDVIKELQGYGFEPRQAEGVVEVLKKTTEAGNEDLATKGDLKAVEVALRSEIREVEISLDAKIDKVETTLKGEMAVLGAKLDILKWIGGVIALAAVSATIKYFLSS
jgi:hypothetical protein